MPALGQIAYFTSIGQAGFKGQAYGNEFVAFLPVGGSANIPCGLFVVKNSSGQIVLPSAASQKYAGILLAGNTVPFDKDATPPGYYAKPGERGQYMAKGFAFGIAEVDLVAGDPVFVRHTANGSPAANEGIGRVRKNANTDKASSITAFVAAPASAGQPVLLFIDLNPVPEANTGG